MPPWVSAMAALHDMVNIVNKCENKDSSLFVHVRYLDSWLDMINLYTKCKREKSIVQYKQS